MASILFILRLALGGGLLAVLTSGMSGNDQPSSRTVMDLNGPWQFQREGASDWRTVTVPSCFQDHEGAAFHGVGWYKKTIEPFILPPGKRALLHVEAAATLAEVWWDGHKQSSHLGGWTPFRVDVTQWLRQRPDQPHEIRIRVDEKVGHNTQGFLPIIAPHFGGLWQEVQLIIVPEAYLDDLRLLAIGNANTGSLEVEIPVRGGSAASEWLVDIRYRPRAAGPWSSTTFRARGTLVKTALAVPERKTWSPREPNLYELAIRLRPSNKPADQGGDLIHARAAFREIAVAGDRLMLNGKPLGIRGLLNWGYYPPALTPNAGEKTFRTDLEFARGLGFNLMKFCLWVPPRRFLELADEMGFLTWMEYPTWHPALTKDHVTDLTREFGEFFAYDRNHPSVVLRSLTCETGPSADLQVVRGLYDLAHRMVPGSMIEDDSSWIGWNRVSDFYDDHPYGNNHTWVAALAKLKEYMRTHGIKPLELGEAIAADTWTEREPLIKTVGKEKPFWLPGFWEDSGRWLARMHGIAGAEGLGQLGPDSRRYALLMRKYQVETFRREVPRGGYVVSVIRDFPLAAMGLLDYQGKSKWSERQWRWQRETMCLLATEADRRTFAGGETLRADVLISHFGVKRLERSELTVTLKKDDESGTEIGRVREPGLFQEAGTLRHAVTVRFPLPTVKRPTRFLAHARLTGMTGEFTNEWPMWVLPASARAGRPPVLAHASVPVETVAELFPGASPFTRPTSIGAIVVARRVDDSLLDCLEQGGKVLLLPDGEVNSLPLADHWFLRGGPYISGHPLLGTVPRDLLVETQHFDLASRVVPDIRYLEQTDPILMLWDNHDIKEVRTHGLIFETRVGKGRLLVSAVRHGGATNAVGHWLLDVLLGHLATGPEPRHEFTRETRRRLREKIHAQQIELVKRPWRFMPDLKNEGMRRGWHLSTEGIDKEWKEIHIGKSWESEGYPDLDGWAWYRIAVAVPPEWNRGEIYLTFEGVDDYYEVFVNGKPAGKGGDLEKRITAFDEKKSHRLTGLVKPGETCVIAVRVNDFGGAGGIFRPVFLGTAAYAPEGDVLQ